MPIRHRTHSHAIDAPMRSLQNFKAQTRQLDHFAWKRNMPASSVTKPPTVVDS